MRIRTSAILLCLAAAACTVESTTPTAVAGDARRDAVVADSAAAPTPIAPPGKGSTIPVVIPPPPPGKGGSVPAV